MLFKRHLAAQIRIGAKTRTCRVSRIKYKVGSFQPIQENFKEKAKDHIKITSRYQQRLCDVTEEQARAEGFSNLTAFLEWMVKNQAPFFPWRTVDAYEFFHVKRGVCVENQ